MTYVMNPTAQAGGLSLPLRADVIIQASYRARRLAA